MNCQQLKALKQRIDRLAKSADMDVFCCACCKELAARLLALVIPATPVGNYPKGSGKKGGTLRRGWTAQTHDEAASGAGKSSAKAGREYAQTLAINKTGSMYTVEIINPVEYASYVEFGHRKLNGGWQPGRYMLTISEEKLKKTAPGVLEKKLLKFMSEVLK